MRWLLPILGGFILGRMATGETAQEAIQNTLSLPKKYIAQQSSDTEIEDNAPEVAALFG